MASRKKMFFFTFRAHPVGEPGSRKYAGAFVNCCIEAADQESAEARARSMIEESSWRIDSLEENRVVSDEDYPPGAEGKEFYEQALIDKEVLVFHTWPVSSRHGAFDSWCVADIEGPWVESNFDSGLIERCRRYWSVPVADLPNVILATYLRQRIALTIMIPEARMRVEAGFDDDSEMYDGELSEVLRDAPGSDRSDLDSDPA